MFPKKKVEIRKYNIEKINTFVIEFKNSGS